MSFGGYFVAFPIKKKKMKHYLKKMIVLEMIMQLTIMSFNRPKGEIDFQSSTYEEGKFSTTYPYFLKSSIKSAN